MRCKIYYKDRYLKDIEFNEISFKGDWVKIEAREEPGKPHPSRLIYLNRDSVLEIHVFPDGVTPDDGL